MGSSDNVRDETGNECVRCLKKARGAGRGVPGHSEEGCDGRRLDTLLIAYRAAEDAAFTTLSWHRPISLPTDTFSFSRQ